MIKILDQSLERVRRRAAQRLIEVLPECPECFDRGYIKTTQYEGLISWEIKMPCPTCEEKKDD